ncbi:hypothetical protein KDD17_10355 [Sulfitobacter albidus]|uniref:Uncharacterized protein n=1 Tax=Sulfitobacter albidus TaxID=2829501 RepID=A0A975JBF3_9RHOB|nr:hypothetical protein [Sulfitobacter albidus]QUJ75384.1 hypothetical protein KDD17_10355 [Sulfitobacter albidus]
MTRATLSDWREEQTEKAQPALRARKLLKELDAKPSVDIAAKARQQILAAKLEID